jgi:7,8-dihydro-6-hydroxymethylpterin dimethyltransferase
VPTADRLWILYAEKAEKFMTDDLSRKSKPYLFYGQTTSLCEECMELVPAKILVEGKAVFYQKRCPTHGVQKTKISSDYGYYKQQRDYLKPGDVPLKLGRQTEYGCPYDCGLCPDHEQHSCLALIEVNDSCNLTCPVCFAESSPHRQSHKSLEEVEAMLDTIVAHEGEPDLVQISGGEPTIHPQILEILHAAKSRPIRHLMLNTNGIRIAQDPDFVAELAKLKPGFEVYLQFDSLQPSALKNIRGRDLTAIRAKALANLEAAGIATTLVVVVKRGVNDQELGDIIRHALTYRCVRGVTFQPVQDAGRNIGFDKNTDRVLLTDVRQAILDQYDALTPEDIIPLPCNPDQIAIAYALRHDTQLTPVTRLIPQDEFVAAVPNTVTFERYPEIRQKLFDLLSLGTVGAFGATKLSSLLCCLPQVEAPSDFGYDRIFRIVIVQFLDKYNFCVGTVKRSCVHFVTPSGEIIPFDTYNLFYRNGQIDTIRAKRKAGDKAAPP